MNNPLVRWWIIFSVSIIAMTTTLFGGMAKFIWKYDQTYLSWGILGVYLIGSFILFFVTKGLQNKTKNDELSQNKEYCRKVLRDGPHFGTVNYCIDTLTSLGLLGTIIGLILMVVGAFSNLDISNQDSVQQALVGISSGVGTALITTLTGLVCAILLRLQLVVTKGG